MVSNSEFSTLAMHFQIFICIIQYYKMNFIYEISDKSKASALWALGCTFWVIAFIYPIQLQIDPSIICLWRAILITFINTFLIHTKGIKINIVNDEDYTWCIVRVLCFSLSALIFAFVQFYLPLPIIYGLTSIIYVISHIINMFIQDYTVNYLQRIGIIILSFGVVVVCLSNHTGKNQIPFSPLILILLFICLVCAGVFVSKRIVSVHPNTQSFHLGIGLIFISSFVFCLFPSQISADTYLYGFVLTGLPMVLCQVLKQWAFQIHTFSGTMWMLQSFTVPISYIVSLLILRQAFDIWGLVGNALIIMGGYRIMK